MLELALEPELALGLVVAVAFGIVWSLHSVVAVEGRQQCWA